MAFYRRRRTFGRRFGRRRRFASFTRADRPRIQVGNFNFQDYLTLDGTESTVQFWYLLASIPQSIGGGGTAQTAIEGKVREMTRSIDVSGLVINHGYFNLGPFIETNYNSASATPTGELRMTVAQTLIVADRCDGDGAPNGILYAWGNNTGPSRYGTFGSTTEEGDMPSRILYRDAELLNSNRLPFSTGSGIVSSESQAIHRRQRKVRTRVRLNEEHGLYLVITMSAYTTAELALFALNPMHVYFWATGSIYYRWNI